MNHEKSNFSVTVIIILMIIFPVATLLTEHYTKSSKDSVEKAFDTLAVPGYTYFTLHRIEINENADTALYNAIFPLIGIPHRSRANSNGLDCSGFVKKVFQEAFKKTLKGSSGDIYQTGTPIRDTELRESDLVFFTIGGTQINHVGIYLNNGKFAHASSSAGVTINDLNENYYQRHYKGAARITIE